MYPFEFNALFPDATDEQKWEQIRLWRANHLAQCDWTQLADSKADKAAWAIYRQSLRDLPAQGGKADDAEFPTKP